MGKVNWGQEGGRTLNGKPKKFMTPEGRKETFMIFEIKSKRF